MELVHQKISKRTLHRNNKQPLEITAAPLLLKCQSQRRKKELKKEWQLQIDLDIRFMPASIILYYITLQKSCVFQTLQHCNVSSIH